MNEFITNLVAEIEKEYKSALMSDSTARGLIKKIEKSTSYNDAHRYAERLTKHMGKALENGFNQILTEENPELFFGTAVDVLTKPLKTLYSDATEVSKTIQRNKNASDGINLAPQLGKFSEYDVKDLASELVKSPSDVAAQVKTFGHSAVDRTQRKNIGFVNSTTGGLIKITRKYDGVGLHTTSQNPIGCEYCMSKQGTRTFESYQELEDSEMMARHAGCGCLIDYENMRTGTKDSSVSKFSKAKI